MENQLKNTNQNLHQRLASKNPDFFQFYKHNFRLITYIQRKYPTAASIFFFIVEHMGPRNSLVISVNAMAEILDVNRSTITRNIKHLVKHEMIDIIYSGGSKIYALNADIVWSNKHCLKETAEFCSKVIVSKNEQNQYDHEIKKKNHAHISPKKLNDPLKANQLPWSRDKKIHLDRE